MTMKRAVAAATILLALTTAGCVSPSAAGPGPARGRDGPGDGMGPGMMGQGDGPGWGMGPGMMGGFGPGIQALPSLTADQRSRLAGIQQELAQRQWPLMQQMHQLMWSRGGGSIDEQQERGNYDAAAKLHRQMFENSLQARRQMEAVLTAEQREQLRRAWSGRGATRPGAPG